MSEFKEFWIYESQCRFPAVARVIREEKEDPKNWNEIHVIEYSALEAANARIRELEKKLHIAKKALEFYKEYALYGDTATMALKELE